MTCGLDLGGALLFSQYIAVCLVTELWLSPLFFLRPLPYEALTKLIDEASEGDMNISILTQVSGVRKPNPVVDIWTFFSIDHIIGLLRPGPSFLSVFVPCAGNTGLSSHVHANSTWPLCWNVSTSNRADHSSYGDGTGPLPQMLRYSI